MMRVAKAGNLLSGALAKATGVSADTIRHYERIGILPRPFRTESGYRLYPRNAVERVLIVRNALRIGFTLAELAEVLGSRDAGGAPCHRVLSLARQKLDRIGKEIAALKRTESYLKKVVADGDPRVKEAGPGQKVHLLYSLVGATNHGDTPVKFQRNSK